MQCTAPSRPPRLQVQPDVWLDGRLALWLPEHRAVVVADLHWGYVESHRAQGNLLPAWGDAQIADRLQSLIDDYQPAEMIWLGDSLHSLAGRTAAETFLARTAVPIAILSGNHDKRWSRVASGPTVRRGRFFLHHGDCPLDVPPGAVEIIGHHHPALAWADGAGSRLKLPALVLSEHRLVMPAFSPWAAGAPWKTRCAGEIVYAIGTKRIFTLSPPLLHKATPVK